MARQQCWFLKCMWFGWMIICRYSILHLYSYFIIKILKKSKSEILSSEVLNWVCSSWRGGWMQLKQEVLRFTIFLCSETHLSMYLSFTLLIYLFPGNCSIAQKSGIFSQVGCVQPRSWRVSKRRVEGSQLKPVYAAVTWIECVSFLIVVRAAGTGSLTHGSC